VVGMLLQIDAGLDDDRAANFAERQSS
jgi:hypothetical protein